MFLWLTLKLLSFDLRSYHHSNCKKGCQRGHMRNSCRIATCFPLPLDISKLVLWWSKQAEFFSNYLASSPHFSLKSSTKLILIKQFSHWSSIAVGFIMMDWVCAFLNKHNKKWTNIIITYEHACDVLSWQSVRFHDESQNVYFITKRHYHIKQQHHSKPYLRC